MFDHFSSKLEDGSEQVKKELARIIGQLCCLQSELSSLSDIHTESTCVPKILCLRCSLAADHAGKAVPSLKAAVIRPFLPLLRPQAPSSVKQGTLGYFSVGCFLLQQVFHNSKEHDAVASVYSRCFLIHFIHFTASFPRSSSPPVSARESDWCRQRLAGRTLRPHWSNAGFRSCGQNMLQPISAFPADKHCKEL